MPSLRCMSRPAMAALAATTTFALGVTAPPRLAHGDDDNDRAELLVELAGFEDAIASAKDDGDGDRAADAFGRPASDCDDVMARLAKHGVKPTDVCRSYARWQAAVEAAGVVALAGTDLATTSSLTAGQASEAFATTFGQSAGACTAAVDHALAAGVPPGLAVRIRSNLGDRSMTLAAARATICDPLTAWAREFGPATIAAKRAQEAAARQRYSQFGAAGDRLSWLAYYDADATGATWYLPGCKAEREPKKLVRAPVLMQWWTADDGTITIRRFQFKGNKLVGDTSRTFITEAAAHAGCR